MSRINIALKNVIGFIFLSVMLVEVGLFLLAAVGGFSEDGLRYDRILIAFVVTLFIFSLFCLLWEITENTRFLRDAVQSGSSDKQSDSIY
jgi:hypothetical protein